MSVERCKRRKQKQNNTQQKTLRQKSEREIERGERGGAGKTQQFERNHRWHKKRKLIAKRRCSPKF